MMGSGRIFAKILPIVIIAGAAGVHTAPSHAFVNPQAQAPAKPAAEVPDTLSQEEYDFLIKLGQHLNHPPAEERIQAIIGHLMKTPRLTKKDYDFLLQLSKDVASDKIATHLADLCKRHSPSQSFEVPERGDPLSDGEKKFLNKLAESISSNEIKIRVREVIRSLERNPTLSASDYDFLMKLSAKVNHPVIAGDLATLAQARAPADAPAVKEEPARELAQKAKTLTKEEYQALMSASKLVGSNAMLKRIYAIIEWLKKRPLLNPADYDFLIQLAGRMDNAKARSIFLWVADSHRPMENRESQDENTLTIE